MESMPPKAEGGVRTTEHLPKRSRPGYPLVSIITVCLNSERYLEQTIRSVINQTYDNIEYVIIDGGSTDNTLNIIKKYEDSIDYWMSEPDKGIYDAMNKGNNIATGDYILFLNSNDYLYNNKTIERVIKLAIEEHNEKPLLIAGQVKIALGDEVFDWVWPINKKVLNKYNPPHQSILIAVAIYKNIHYNTSFKSAGDTEFWLRLKTTGLFQIKFVPVIISVFRLGGVSSQGKTEYYRCIERAIARYLNLRHFNIPGLLMSLSRAFFKNLLLTILGEKIYYKYIIRGAFLLKKKFYS